MLRTQRTHPVAREFQDWVTRVVEIDGEPWFVAADVCRVLSLHVKSDGKVNTTVALAKLDQDEIGSYPIGTNARNGGTRTQVVKVINRSGLDRMIMRSDKPEARAFQDWVIGVVLPAIRKDGGYIMGQEKGLTTRRDHPELFRGSRTR